MRKDVGAAPVSWPVTQNKKKCYQLTRHEEFRPPKKSHQILQPSWHWPPLTRFLFYLECLIVLPIIMNHRDAFNSSKIRQKRQGWMKQVLRLLMNSSSNQSLPETNRLWALHLNQHNSFYLTQNHREREHAADRICLGKTYNHNLLLRLLCEPAEQVMPDSVWEQFIKRGLL